MEKKNKRTKLSITIDAEIYNKFVEKLEKECVNKSKLFDKLIKDWLDVSLE